ncbi:MAG: RNA methyltransferase [Candidatus Nanohaloarchaea archaeon]
MEKIVLVEPEVPGNTGFIARLASNFEANIRIVNPGFNLSKARKTANNSQKKLREAKIYDRLEEAIENLDHVVGTKPGKGIALNSFKPRVNTSLVIGRESSGLTNEELEKCDAVVHIETGDYSSINQSHATAILMHKFFTTEVGKANFGNLGVLKDDVGEKTMELLKRSSPTKGETQAVIAEIKESKKDSM